MNNVVDMKMRLDDQNSLTHLAASCNGVLPWSSEDVAGCITRCWNWNKTKHSTIH